MPAIGLAEGLLITANTLPAVSVLFATATKLNCAPLSMVTPLAITLSALALLVFSL